MKTLKFLIAGSLMLNLATAKAQLIEEDGTEILDKERGEALFTLDAKTEIYSFDPNEGWYKIRREVFVDPEQVVDDKTLLSGTELRNKEGELIGKTLKEIEIIEGAEMKKYRGKKPYHAIIEGFVFKTKLENGSSPEVWVSRILEMKNRTDQQAELASLFATYDFEERNFDQFTALVYREQHKVLSEEKDFRIIMVFRGETPYAVVSNDHSNVTAPKVKLEKEDGAFRFIYFYKPPASQQSIIEDDIVYTYLAL